MGCCTTRSNGIAIQPRLISVRPNPSIFIEENFKFMVYTQTTKEIKEFSVLRKHFENYKITDIRCVKRSSEGEEVHSSLIVISNQSVEEKPMEELW